MDATKNDIDRSTLRSGTSCARNILGIAEVGDASIEEAAKKADITKIRTYDELPQNAKKYIARLEELMGVRISIISVGPDRDQTIFR